MPKENEQTPATPAEQTPAVSPGNTGDTPPAAPAAPPAAPAAANPFPEGDWRNNDPVFRGMMAGLGNAIGEEPAAEPATTPEEPTLRTGRTIGEIMASNAEKPATPAETPAETPPVTPGTPTPPAAAEPPKPPESAAPIQVERRQSVDSIIERTVAKTLEKLPPKEPAPLPLAAAQPDAIEAGLVEAEREELAFARYAAEKDPSAKDYPERLLAFYKKQQAQIDKFQKDNPDRTFGDDDEEFTKWNRVNRPVLDPSKRRRLERQQSAEAAATQVREEMRAEMEDVRQQARRAEVMPAIEKVTAGHLASVEKQLLKDPNSIAAPIIEQAAKVGWDAVTQADQIFAPIVRGYQETSAQCAHTFKMISEGVEKFTMKNPIHLWLFEFVEKQGKAVVESGNSVRNGRTFLSRQEYNALVEKNPSAASKHWAFSDQEVLDMLTWNTAETINLKLKEQDERLTKSGFARQKPAATPTTPSAQNPVKETSTPPAAQPKPAAHVSPRATVSAAPGAGKVTPVNNENPHGLQILQAHGLR